MLLYASMVNPRHATPTQKPALSFSPLRRYDHIRGPPPGTRICKDSWSAHEPYLSHRIPSWSMDRPLDEVKQARLGPRFLADPRMGHDACRSRGWNPDGNNH